MERPKVITNWHFFCLFVLVVLWLVLVAVLYPFDTAAKILTLLGLIFGTGLAGAVIASIFQTRFLSKESIWLQPVSETITLLLINSVVLVFLCGIGFLILLMLEARGSRNALLGVIFSLFAGAGLGWYLKRHFSRKSLLPYGLGFFSAFIVILVLFATMGGAHN